MKKLLLSFALTTLVAGFLNAQVTYINEPFNGVSLPAGWTAALTAHSAASANWVMSGNGIGNSSFLFYTAPPGNTYFANVWQGSVVGDSANLTSPVMNLTGVPTATVKFYYMASDSFRFVDKLRVLYKTTLAGAMTNIAFTCHENTHNIVWDSATLTFPGGSSTTYLVFQGISNGDDGVGLAKVKVTGTPSGINELSNYTKLSVYPNPASDKFYIQLTGSERAKTISLYSVMGQKVWQGNGTGNSIEEIPVTGLAQGLYFIQMLSQNGTISEGKVEVSK